MIRVQRNIKDSTVLQLYLRHDFCNIIFKNKYI